MKREEEKKKKLFSISHGDVPIADWVRFADEMKNESPVVSVKTWFLPRDCRSCFFVEEEETCRDLDRWWELEFDESL